ncbi:uncharacterized protein PADG_05077 [Paracoccidioides brasiliensis Pb18]|uniref:F-box domain-containing protein n=1 Tax=Paracoccidioides brasiliensis (strain Pb18) TaxID=502780 RepID=C1GBS6_PARBD|nr:uncharacterized protein PADG_05077 [Paracoccidioides brasiliensis Pb18]EEH48998.2 hypothetical protein PADG_05077 [Paracoccidioides brasiliensis Pb18]
MHPEPSRTFLPATNESQSPLSQPNSTQYGLRQHDEILQNYFSHESSWDGSCNPSPADASDGAGPTPLPNQISRQPSPTGPVKSVSPVDRIINHENAFNPPSRRAKEFEFRVFPSRNNGISGQTLDQFPNEVLTHILSHLPPSSLSSMSLVSRRFHNLVTTPHAWRIAFSRYFRGPASLSADRNTDDYELILAQRRAFCRLTALASWRNEYIFRTRLLQALSRGKPAELKSSLQLGSPRQQPAQNSRSVFTYSSMCMYPITHVDATFGSPLNNKPPLCIHGAAEQGVASMSDPSSGKTGIGSWGLSSRQIFKHFSDIFPGEAGWGLGPGNMVGMPNVMDVSQPYGMVYGEACPQGRIYYLPSNEKHGRFLSGEDVTPQPHLGIPSISTIGTAICSVWIAKSPQILKITNGLCGILCGSSLGILTAYALGPNPSYDQRFERGQVTAKWVLCPGVPIIAINVDENYSARRYTQQRIWAVILNALGEAFYLTDIPHQPALKPKSSTETLERLAWETGRTVRWELIEPSRRVARPDPFNRLMADGSYSPRSSSNFMGLISDQIYAETKEIENFLTFKPKHFRKVCEGWDMRRRLEVDFAGDNYRNSGESVVILDCGFGENRTSSIRRYLRLKGPAPTSQLSDEADPSIPRPQTRSIFGGRSTSSSSVFSTPSRNSESFSGMDAPVTTQWRMSDFVFDEHKPPQITTSAMDKSTFAQLTTFEDPLLGMCGGSAISSKLSFPQTQSSQVSSPADIPGERACYMAIGTSTGSLYVWNIRAAASQMPDITNKISPIRIIQTDSPQVSCVALTSLYLVHGGSDGLVQAWDPLASSMQPIRTLNSRFSSGARRRLVQAETSTQGVGHNSFAAGAIYLDPDPTVLRGIVSLGSHLRYWSYSSSAADQYKSTKRRLRYSRRGHNSSSVTQRFTSSGRGALQDYIESERYELEQQKKADQKERELLSGRFGVDLLGPDATEEDLIAYGQMLSEESYTSDERKRKGNEGGVESSSSSETITPNEKFDSNSNPDATLAFTTSSSPSFETVAEELDPDIAEAIRFSLLDESFASSSNAPFKFMSSSGNSISSSYPSPGNDESTMERELGDLEFAIQLSLADQEGREGNGYTDSGSVSASWGEEGDFPASETETDVALPSKGKGKASTL